jgi:hypothetical protein
MKNKKLERRIKNKEEDLQVLFYQLIVASCLQPEKKFLTITNF